MLSDVYDVKTVRRIWERMFDYLVVLCRLKIVGGWLEKLAVDNTEVRIERLSSLRGGVEYMRLLASNNGELWMEGKIEKM